MGTKMHRFSAVASLFALSLLPATAHADFLPTCTRAAFALVIDRSGSMTGQPIESAKAAAAATVDKLSANDCVGVITFDSSPTTVVAMHPLTDPATVKAAIARIQPGGGTEILTALDAAHKALLGAPAARKKHVVLLTDGQSPTAGLQALVQTMSGELMTLSTIGFGDSTDEQTLKMLASTGSGRFYRVTDPTTLARTFTREVDTVLAP